MMGAIQCMCLVQEPDKDQEDPNVVVHPELLQILEQLLVSKPDENSDHRKCWAANLQLVRRLLLELQQIKVLEPAVSQFVSILEQTHRLLLLLPSLHGCTFSCHFHAHQEEGLGLMHTLGGAAEKASPLKYQMGKGVSQFKQSPSDHGTDMLEVCLVVLVLSILHVQGMVLMHYVLAAGTCA